jgi:hypothetical protein
VRRIAPALLLAALAGVACSGTSPEPSAKSSPWKQLAPLGSGGHPPEPGSNDTPKWEPGKFPLGLPPVLAFNGELWMTSRTNAWSSKDGLRWEHYGKTDTTERIWHAIVYFKDRLWYFGGLRYADRVPVNEIWSSADGKSWTGSRTAPWSPRKEHTVVAFGDRLWLFGGADKVKSDFTTEHALNDIWSSEDGLNWTEVTGAAPWAAREGPPVLVLGDAMFLVGAQGKADVWRSTDGANWTLLTRAAPWGARSGYGSASFDGRLWVFGGWKNKPTNALNDVWYSSDGESWTRQTEHAPWGPRGPLSVVFKDRLWIYSGKHTGARDSWGGDIWTMSPSSRP